MHALTAAGVPAEDAYNATQGIANMAGQNITATLNSWKAAQDAKLTAQDAKLTAQGAELAAQGAELAAQLAGLDTKLKMLMWMIPVAVAIIGILFRVLT